MFNPCILIPTYNNPATIGDVTKRAHLLLANVVIVDDGSAKEGHDAIEALAGIAHILHRPENGGKGAAVKSGFEFARSLGFSHALQVDADGQHDLNDIPKLLAAAKDNPQALILGAPQYDKSAPKSRRIARRITQFWVNLASGSKAISDPMCGFRVYPLAATKDLNVGADAMDFDPEIAVRLVWRGLRVINIPTAVQYFEGGVSHFRLLHDNLLISWMHTRLMFWRSLSVVRLRRLR